MAVRCPVRSLVRTSGNQADGFREGSDRVRGASVKPGQEGPLILERLECRRVEEDRHAATPALTVQRQRDQVAERSVGHEVLGREEPVVAGEVELGPGRHGLPQEKRADPPSG